MEVDTSEEPEVDLVDKMPHSEGLAAIDRALEYIQQQEKANFPATLLFLWVASADL